MTYVGFQSLVEYVVVVDVLLNIVNMLVAFRLFDVVNGVLVWPRTNH